MKTHIEMIYLQIYMGVYHIHIYTQVPSRIAISSTARTMGLFQRTLQLFVTHGAA